MQPTGVSGVSDVVRFHHTPQSSRKGGTESGNGSGFGKNASASTVAPSRGAPTPKPVQSSVSAELGPDVPTQETQKPAESGAETMLNALSETGPTQTTPKQHESRADTKSNAASGRGPTQETPQRGTSRVDTQSNPLSWSRASQETPQPTVRDLQSDFASAAQGVPETGSSKPGSLDREALNQSVVEEPVPPLLFDRKSAPAAPSLGQQVDVLVKSLEALNLDVPDPEVGKLLEPITTILLDRRAEARLRPVVVDCLPEDAPAERLEATLKVLLEEGVSATELQSLARTAQFRTLTRTVTNYLLVNLSSFGVAGGITASMAEDPPIDPAGLSKYALKLAKRLNFLTTYLASNAAIGVGGEVMMSTLRDGGTLKGGYVTAGKAWPESRAGKIYRALHMWTFSVTHGYLPTLGLKPVESAKLHVLAGALAAMTAGMLMVVISSLYTKPDPVWLDGRGAGAEKLRARIGHLRESSAVATGGYVKDIVKGAGKAVTSPSKEFIVRALLRFALAFVALSGRIPAAFSDNENDKVKWNMGTGIFVGLVWGAALWAHEYITTPSAPATAATPGQVAAIAPPLNPSAEAGPSPDHQV